MGSFDAKNDRRNLRRMELEEAAGKAVVLVKKRPANVDVVNQSGGGFAFQSKKDLKIKQGDLVELVTQGGRQQIVIKHSRESESGIIYGGSFLDDVYSVNESSSVLNLLKGGKSVSAGKSHLFPVFCAFALLACVGLALSMYNGLLPELSESMSKAIKKFQ